MANRKRPVKDAFLDRGLVAKILPNRCSVRPIGFPISGNWFSQFQSIVKIIFKSFAAGEFDGLRRLNRNHLTGRRISSLSFRSLAHFQFADAGERDVARRLQFLDE